MELKNISKVYHTKKEKVEALKDFSYKFDDGKLIAIMGHSGSGKSTLIKIMGLMDTCDEGKIIIDDKVVNDLSEKELADIRMKNIGFVFQDYYLDIDLKAIDNVILPMIINDNISRSDRKKKAEYLLKFVGLGDRMNHYPRELSGGEQQRVAIARCLANDPSIILCDEPTGNLDEDNEKIIFKMLSDLSKKGKCVVVVSHSNEIKKYADEVISLKGGKLVKNNETK